LPTNGFSDQSLAFRQVDPASTRARPWGLSPFHLDNSTTNAACTHDISHDWVPQHQSWNQGAMNGFVGSRLPINSNDAILSMGYYTRADIPSYYALADAFTICDNWKLHPQMAVLTSPFGTKLSYEAKLRRCVDDDLSFLCL
jgi:phospholipase C